MIDGMHLGEQGALHEGEIGYIPEGVAYGPRDDPLGDPKQSRWVPQFDGVSGLGMPLARGAGPGKKESQRRPRVRGLQRLPRGWFGGVAFGGYETAQRIATAIGIAVATTLSFRAEATEGGLHPADSTGAHLSVTDVWGSIIWPNSSVRGT
jgi:hypothetical protein